MKKNVKKEVKPVKQITKEQLKAVIGGASIRPLQD